MPLLNQLLQCTMRTLSLLFFFSAIKCSFLPGVCGGDGHLPMVSAVVTFKTQKVRIPLSEQHYYYFIVSSNHKGTRPTSLLATSLHQWRCDRTKNKTLLLFSTTGGS